MAPKTLVGCEEFERMCLAQELGHCELVDGEVIHLVPGGPEHSFVSNNVGRIIGNYVSRHRLGRVFGNEAGIHTRFEPPCTRGMDVAYFSYRRLPRGRLPKGFFRRPPELVVEVLGEDSTWASVERKVREYHEMGVDMVWIADPDTRTVKQCPRGAEPAVIPATGELGGGDILPGFTVTVAQFFDEDAQ
ncbi:MAG: Uma2 family endonuclease [Planctomycetota bacterium]|nr:Uma2 family endonuclease [Planctomycetota bacterium]